MGPHVFRAIANERAQFNIGAPLSQESVSANASYATLRNARVLVFGEQDF